MNFVLILFYLSQRICAPEPGRRDLFSKTAPDCFLNNFGHLAFAAVRASCSRREKGRLPTALRGLHIKDFVIVARPDTIEPGLTVILFPEPIMAKIWQFCLTKQLLRTLDGIHSSLDCAIARIAFFMRRRSPGVSVSAGNAGRALDTARRPPRSRPPPTRLKRSFLETAGTRSRTRTGKPEGGGF